MKDLNTQLKDQGLISSFGQPLGSSILEEDCIACTNCITNCVTCVGCVDCVHTAPSC